MNLPKQDTINAKNLLESNSFLLEKEV